MAAQSPAELQHRLAEQLQALSQVSEALLFRLLELEERLGTVEQQLASLNVQEDRAGLGLGADCGVILALTEERLARLEDLLSGRRQPFGAAGGAGVPAFGLDGGFTGAKASAKALAAPSRREAAFDPFPEEEEPFMDELIA